MIILSHHYMLSNSMHGVRNVWRYSRVFRSCKSM